MASDHERLDLARRELDLSVYEVWIAYVSLGGSQDAFSVKGYLAGTTNTMTAGDATMLSQAINEIARDLGLPSPLPTRAP